MLNAVNTGLHPSPVVSQFPENYGVSEHETSLDVICRSMNRIWWKLKESCNFRGVC